LAPSSDTLYIHCLSSIVPHGILKPGITESVNLFVAGGGVARQLILASTCSCRILQPSTYTGMESQLLPNALANDSAWSMLGCRFSQSVERPFILMPVLAADASLGECCHSSVERSATFCIGDRISSLLEDLHAGAWMHDEDSLEASPGSVQILVSGFRGLKRFVRRLLLMRWWAPRVRSFQAGGRWI